jgi:hypothetical protein
MRTVSAYSVADAVDSLLLSVDFAFPELLFPTRSGVQTPLHKEGLAGFCSRHLPRAWYRAAVEARVHSRRGEDFALLLPLLLHLVHVLSPNFHADSHCV